MMAKTHGNGWLARRLVSMALLVSLIASGVSADAQEALPEGLDRSIDGAMTDADAADLLANAPLSFEKNLGQSDLDVVFFARAPGYAFFLTPQEAVFELSEDEVVRMGFVGAQATPSIQGNEPLPGVSNYFLGDDPDGWTPDVPHFREVLVQDLWPGIDVVFMAQEGAVRYDFIVHPGADPALIRLAFNGAEPRVEEDGALGLYGDGLLLRQPAPLTFQDIGTERVAVASGFRVSAPGEVGFEVGSYDAAFPLVIDPVVLRYSTFLGGSENEFTRGITVDADGNAYVTGQTTSTDFPTLNAYQETQPGDNAVFVTKFAADGTLAYSTYLGGSSFQLSGGIAVDADGNAYVTGGTGSADFPILNAYQETHPGGTFAAFVTKFAADGTLAYSTYLGGSSSDQGQGIAVDADGNIYVSGTTHSTAFPTKNAFQATHPGGNIAVFVTKFATDGSLTYSTYLGGSSLDFSAGIAVDANGNVYVAGETQSTDFPTESAYQTTHPGGTRAVFVTKFAVDGTLAYSTYLGGSGSDSANGIAVDADGNAHVTGSTPSTDFPTLDAYQATHPGGTLAAYVTKFAADGTLAYSTYLGGSDFDLAQGIAVDANGNIYVAGNTQSTDFPVLNAYQATHPAPSSAAVFVTKFAGDGTLAYSTYLGGSSFTGSQGIAVDANGNAYVNGDTTAADFPTENAFQENHPGGPLASFVTSLNLPTPPTQPLDLMADVTDVGEISLQWSAPADDGGSPITEYRIYSGPTAEELTFLTEVTGSQTSHVDAGLGNGETWHYNVTAINAVGEGPGSAPTSATTWDVPDEPRALQTVTGPDLEQITLDWTAPQDDGGTPVTAYRLYRSATEDGPYDLVESLPEDTTSHTDDGLGNLTTWYYKLAAANVVGEGPFAPGVNETTYDPMNIPAMPGGNTLQHAVNIVAPGGTVHAFPGDYEEDVVVAKPLTLQKADETQLGGLDGDATSIPTLTGSIQAEAGGLLIIKDFQMDATRDGPRVGVALTAGGFSALTIENVTLRADGPSQGAGLFPALVEVSGIENVAFVNNTMEGDPGAGGLSGGLLVRIPGTGMPVVQIEGNDVHDFEGAAVLLTGHNADAVMQVDGNEFVKSGFGIMVYDATYGSLGAEANVVHTNEVGVRVIGPVTGDSTFRYNSIVGNDLGFAVSGDTSAMDARHNWWGHAAGPLPGEQANMLAVDYTPWCIDEECTLGRTVDPLLP